jgi:glycosyltransferase involved in cell wall biosynthesis
VFGASYERGGEVCRRVFTKVRETSHSAASELVFASYYTPDGSSSLSKQALAELVASAEFFVYPLVLPSGSVHHDTFACIVLEALAGGVDVVSWDVACLREVFGNHVNLLQTPTCTGYDPHARFGRNPNMLSDGAVGALADAVLAVDALPVNERERRRREAVEWATSETWTDKAVQMEAELQATK